MIDNASTFFGNPPETLRYEIDGDNILVPRGLGWTIAYQVRGRTLLNMSGAVLTEK